MKKLLKSWTIPVAWFTVGVIYVTYIWKYEQGITFNKWYDRVIPLVFPPAIWLMLKIMIATGIMETESMTKARKQREADEFAAMTPEVQQLHIHAKNKVAEFNFNLVVYLITSIASGYLIYLCVK